MWRAQCQCLIEGGRSHTNVIATTPHIQLATMKKSVAPFLVYHHADHHTALHQVAKCRQGHMGRKRHIAATERHERETRTSCISVARRHHPHKTSREPNTLQPALTKLLNPTTKGGLSSLTLVQIRDQCIYEDESTQR